MQIANLDKLVSGEDRLINLEQHLAGSFIYRQSSGVEGFYLPTFGEGLAIVKDKFCRARTNEIAIDNQGECGFSNGQFKCNRIYAPK